MKYLLILLALILSGCATQRFTPPPEVVYQTRDSIVFVHIRDSVDAKEIIKIQNDTTIITKETVKYKDRIIKESVRDTVPVPSPYPVYVEKKLNGYQRTMIYLGWALIALLGFKIFKVIRKFYV